MAHRLALAAATAASTEVEFEVTPKAPTSVATSGGMAANTITFDVLLGASWVAYTKTTAVSITATNTSALITEPGRYRVNKPITTNAVGIWLCNGG